MSENLVIYVRQGSGMSGSYYASLNSYDQAMEGCPGRYLKSDGTIGSMTPAWFDSFQEVKGFIRCWNPDYVVRLDN